MKLDVAITSKCNLNCKHCYQGKTNKLFIHEIPYSILKELILQNIKKLKVNELLITGGEPTQHSEFKKIIVLFKRIIKQYKIKITINTNGTQISKSLLELDAKYIISLDGPKKYHDFIRGYNAYNKTIKNIKKLKKYHRTVEIKCIITKDINNWIEKFVNDLKGIGIKKITLNNIFQYGNARQNFKNSKWVVNGVSETEKFYKKCAAIDSLIAINFDGVCYPCAFFRSLQFLSIGNIYCDNITNIHKNAIKLASKWFINTKRCSPSCIVYKKCSCGCKCRSLLTYGDFKSPDPFQCIAKGKKINQNILDKIIQNNII